MRLVVKLPLPSDQGEQALGRGPLGAQARDAIDHFHPCLARFWEQDMTSKLKDLREPGPIAVADEGRTRRDLTLLDAPMAKVDRARCVLPIAAGRERKDQRNIGP